MDSVTSSIVAWALNPEAHCLDDATVHQVSRHLIDSFACALGAISSRPASVARSIAATAMSSPGASIFGLQQQSTPEYAAFANTAMIRFLDYNDTGIGGHPSDMIPAVLALAEGSSTEGSGVVRAIYAEYEVFAALRLAGIYGYKLRKSKIDQVLTVVGSAVGAGLILKLDAQRLSHAISLALTPNIPMRVARQGTISDWKGCATAHTSMMGVFAARLACHGLTGPDRVFEGLEGFCELLKLDPLNLSEIGLPRHGLSAIHRTGLKWYPADYNAHVSIEILLSLRKELDILNISTLTISLHWGAWHSIGGGAGDPNDKWNPLTRETADHSMPFLAAVALLDGEITPNSFTPEKLESDEVKNLMARIHVVHDTSLDALHAGELPTWPATVDVELISGVRVRRSSSCPKGHPRNPLSDQELESKYWAMSESLWPRSQGQRLLDLLWQINKLDDITPIMNLVRHIPVG